MGLFQLDLLAPKCDLRSPKNIKNIQKSNIRADDYKTVIHHKVQMIQAFLSCRIIVNFRLA